MKIYFFSLLFASSLILSTSSYSQTSFQNKSQQEFKISFLEEIKNNDHNESKATLNYSQNKKNTGLAILYSLLLPGMGELYADGYESGKYFTIADGVLWGTFVGMNVYGNWEENRYKSYAETKANVDLAGKDKDYFAIIGQYSSIESYNNEKALERNFDEIYNTERFFWKWNSTEERRTYRDMWSSSEQTFNNVRFVVGALILNRVISAINAVRLVSAYNNRLQDELSWNVSFGVEQQFNQNTMVLNFVKAF